VVNKIKSAVKDKNFWGGIITAVITAVMGFFGYHQVEQRLESPSVDIEIHTPEAEQNWQHAIDKSKKEHEDEYH
jgi:hypothetical protein